MKAVVTRVANARVEIDGNVNDRPHFSAGGTVQIGRNKSVRPGKQLIFFDFIPRIYNKLGTLPGILGNGNGITLQKRRRLNRKCFG